MSNFLKLGDNLLKDLEPKKLPKPTPLKFEVPKKQFNNKHYKRQLRKMRRGYGIV